MTRSTTKTPPDLHPSPDADAAPDTLDPSPPPTLDTLAATGDEQPAVAEPIAETPAEVQVVDAAPGVKHIAGTEIVVGGPTQQ